MTSSEFKSGLVAIKNNLRGLRLQLVHPRGYRPFYTLKEFGNAILDEEAKGYDFRINQVWTSEGVLSVKSFSHLVELINTMMVETVQFESFWQSKTQAEYIRSFGSLD